MAENVTIRISGQDAGGKQLLKDLVTQLKGVETGSSAADRNVAKLSQTWENTGKRLNTLTSGIRSFVLAIGAARVASFVKSRLDEADAIGKMSQKTGIATEKLSVFNVAAGTADTTLEAVGVGFRGLAKNIADLERGNQEVADTFASIGISAKDLNGLKLDEVFLLIANQLKKYESGALKADVATKLFGRSGLALIPLMRDLAGSGFDEARIKAERLGLVFSQQATDAAQKFNDSLTTLKQSAQGAAGQFATGLAPAIAQIADALTSTAGSGGRGKSGLQLMGQFVGRVARDVLVVLSLLAGGIRGIELIVIASVTRMVTAMKLIGTRANFVGAAKELAKLPDDFKKAAETAGRESGEFIMKLLGTDPESIARAKSAAKKATDDATEDELAQIRVKNRVAAAAAAAAATARAELNQQLADNQRRAAAASARIEDAEQSRRFAAGLTSLREFYDARRKIALDALDAEITALRQKRAAAESLPGTTEKDELARKKAVAAVDGELADKQAERTLREIQLNAEQADQERGLLEQRREFIRQLQEFRGQDTALAKGQVQQQIDAYARLLTQLHVVGAERDRALSEFGQSASLRSQFDQVGTDVNRVLEQLRIRRQEISNEAAREGLSEIEVQRRISVEERARLPILQALAAEMRKFALDLGNRDLLQQADALAAELGSIGLSIDNAAMKFRRLRVDMAQAFQNDLAQFLGSTINQVHSLGDAFRQLAISVLESIQRILAEPLSESIIGALRGLFSRGGLPRAPDLSGDIAGAVASAGIGQSSTVASTQLLTAGTTLQAAGVTLGAASTGLAPAVVTLGGAATGLVAAAGALQFAAAALGAGGNFDEALDAVKAFIGRGHASGGLIRGPGTSTSDSIPARLSAGEFVIRAAAVQKYGADFFAALNEAHRPLEIRRSHLRRYAAGGFVEPAAGSGRSAPFEGTMHATLELSPDLVLRELKTSRGVAAIAHVVQSNRGLFRGILADG